MIRETDSLSRFVLGIPTLIVATKQRMEKINTAKTVAHSRLDINLENPITL